MVTSLPSLIIFAFPIGSTNYLSKTVSDTQYVYPYKFQFSKNITGQLHRIAAFRSPLQSSASQGLITIKPGTFAQQLAKHWECWAATAAAGPFNPRNTIAPPISPALMYLVLAQLFTIWSIACREKFIVMNQTIGTNPINEAPIANPVNPIYVIGVSTIRFDPYLSQSPFDILQAPLQLATSSPIRKTLGFRYISSSIAAPKAFLFVSLTRLGERGKCFASLTT